MKQQVSVPIAAGVIAVLVIVIGYFVYNKTTHPYAGDPPKPPMSMGTGSTPMEAPGGKPGAPIGAMMGGGGAVAPPGAPGASPGGMMGGGGMAPAPPAPR